MTDPGHLLSVSVERGSSHTYQALRLSEDHSISPNSTSWREPNPSRFGARALLYRRCLVLVLALAAFASLLVCPWCCVKIQNSRDASVNNRKWWRKGCWEYAEINGECGGTLCFVSTPWDCYNHLQIRLHHGAGAR